MLRVALGAFLSGNGDWGLAGAGGISFSGLFPSRFLLVKRQLVGDVRRFPLPIDPRELSSLGRTVLAGAGD